MELVQNSDFFFHPYKSIQVEMSSDQKFQKDMGLNHSPSPRNYDLGHMT